MAAAVCLLWGCGVFRRSSVAPAAGQDSFLSVPVRYTDVTKEAGLDFIQSDGGCGLRYFVEQVAAGAAVLDANGDGYPDLYFPQPKAIGECVGKVKGVLRQRLYLNDGHGHFRLSAGAFPHDTDYGIAAAVGDYDNDGHPDLYVCCYGRNTLFHNRGDGTFEDVTDRAGVGVRGFSTGAVWFDYDNDGYPDLYVGRYTGWTVASNIPCPGSNRSYTGCDPLTYPPALPVLFHNNRNGTFTDVTRKALPGPPPGRNLGIAAADFDGDGRLDLFVANDLSPNFLFHNNGDGTFQERGMQEGVAFGPDGDALANMGVAVGDYNDTGRLSVAVTTFAKEPFCLYRNDGGFFTEVGGEAGIGTPTEPYLGFGDGFVDTRNSGLLDLFFADGHVVYFPGMHNLGAGYRQRNLLFLNDGRGHFIEAAGALPADDVRVHRGACFASFTNNGKMDIVVSAKEGRPTLLRNDTAAGHWLLLKLVNRQGSADAVGTRCIATIGGRKKLRIVLGGGSYGGDSDHRVHFGLGSATRVDRLEIRWLSGQVQVLQNIPADQILTVHEP